LWQVLTDSYSRLGFTALGDETFMKIVLARIVEPTSKLDALRVLKNLGVDAPASEKTIYRMLERVKKGKYREQLADACFTHASRNTTLTLVMYDATVRREALVIRLGVRDLHRGSCRGRGLGAGGSLAGWTTGWVGAALTKPLHVSTVGWRGSGERAEEVYARNRCHHLS